MARADDDTWRELFDAYRIDHLEDEMTAQFDGFQYPSATLVS